MLSIGGQRSSEHTEKDEAGRFSRFERRFGSFQRRFKLPQNVDTGAISAKVRLLDVDEVHNMELALCYARAVCNLQESLLSDLVRHLLHTGCGWRAAAAPCICYSARGCALAR
jgi:Hsp20/alpha crystallin family